MYLLVLYQLENANVVNEWHQLGNTVVINDDHQLGNTVVINDDHQLGNTVVINDDHQLGNTVAVNTCLLSVRKYSQLLLFFLYEKVVLYFRGQSGRCMSDMGYTIERIFL